MRDIYAETDPDLTGLDSSRRSSDLYSPELNLEAHRTAQEVLIFLFISYNISNNLLSFSLVFNFVFLAHRCTIVYKIHRRLPYCLKITLTNLIYQILIYQIPVLPGRQRYTSFNLFAIRKKFILIVRNIW